MLLLPLVETFFFSLVVLVLLAMAVVAAMMLRSIGKLEKGLRASDSDVRLIEDPNSLDKVPIPSLSSPASKYLSIVFPAFNEERRLPATMEDTMRYLQARSSSDPLFSYEILVVDDGSSDRTSAAALDFSRRFSIDCVRVMRMRRNAGKGAAVRNGVLSCRGELVLFADSDGATRIDDLERLEEEIVSLTAIAPSSSTNDGNSRSSSSSNSSRSSISGGGTSSQPLVCACPGVASLPAAAFGSRKHLEEKALVTRAWYRNILMVGFHFCVLLAAGSGIRDTQCGFKMFTRAAARRIFPNQRLNRWCFDVEIFYLAKDLQIPLVEVPVQWTEIAGSKLRPTSILHMLYELALIRVGYGLGLWRVRKD